MNFLFVCTGNTCRSPMAACLMNAAMRNNGLPGDALSAGVFAREGERASENARLACAERGLDLSAHAARRLSPALMQGRVVLCMGDTHARAARRLYTYDDVFTLSEYAGMRGEIADPYGGDLAAYRACLSEIDKRIAKIVSNGGMRA